MIKNGPARCFDVHKQFTFGSPEFLIHFLVEGVPACKLETQIPFVEMETPIDKLANWKKCPVCFDLKKNKTGGNYE